MSLVLAIDTAAQQCRVGLAEEGKLLDSATGDSSQRAAQEVLPLIDRLLSKQGITLGNLDYLSVISGPGSFTGLRIGVAVAQALSYTQNIPVVPVPSMALLAWAAMTKHDIAHWLVFEVAREPEVYFGFYRCDNTNGACLQGKEQVAPAESLELPEMVLSESEGTDKWGLVGSACTAFSKDPRVGAGIGVFPEIVPDIEDLCELSLRYYRTNSYEQQLVLPNYVKEQMDYS